MRYPPKRISKNESHQAIADNSSQQWTPEQTAKGMDNNNNSNSNKIQPQPFAPIALHPRLSNQQRSSIGDGEHERGVESKSPAIQ
jgi:hypothetical protein